MIEAVFDTNIFLQAATSKTGPANACWKFAEERKIRIFATEATLAELEDVLSRSRLLRQFPQLTDEHFENILTAFRTYCLLVAEPPAVFHLGRDKDDAKFVDLAAVMKASYIVTRDRDLLDLREDSQFSSQFPELNIVTPVGFLEIVRAT